MIVVGSQAILAIWPDAPVLLRMSAEIDAYPANAREWETATHLEASEEINANFGYLSRFHDTHGYYIDGVDETTATLPSDWQDRKVVTRIRSDAGYVFAITPEIHDLAISKICRLESKDIEYVEAIHATHPLKVDVLLERMERVNIPDSVKLKAIAFIRRLT